jgi:hypothetical protein
MNLPRVEFPVTLLVAKGGELCWLGHLDFARAVERALRRSGLPLRFTEGFHKRVKMRLPEPLPLGVGSDAERFVVPLAEERAPDVVAAALAPCLPKGLALEGVLAGSHPEPLDVPVDLDLEAGEVASLAAALAALPAQMPAIGGAWTLVQAASATAAGESSGALALVRLAPPAGGRVSTGRFLALLKEGAPSGFALSRVRRRVAWREPDPSLPSSPPKSEPRTPGSAPCTP